MIASATETDMTDNRNSGTRAIVTGGAQGIGFAVAKQLVAEGCKAVALIGRSQEKGAKAARPRRKPRRVSSSIASRKRFRTPSPVGSSTERA